MGQWVGSGHITKNRVNREVIKIIQFCLKIYDLLRHPHMDRWMGGWMGQWLGPGRTQISNKS